jgi:hypothetical protein
MRSMPSSPKDWMNRRNRKLVLFGTSNSIVGRILNTFSPADIKTLKSTMPGHFTTLWKSRSTNTPSGQLAREAAEYIYSVQCESVNSVSFQTGVSM